MVKNSSGSKYATMAETMKEKVTILDTGINDRIREKQIESEKARIDQELQQIIEEIKSTPIDTELIKKQAEATLISRKKENKRTAMSQIQHAEDAVNKAKEELKNFERRLEITKEVAKESAEKDDLEAEQEYEKTVSSIGNTEKTINLKIEKVKIDAENAKKELNAELDTLIAKREAHQEKVDCIDKLYNDLKEISLKLGDAGK